MASKEKVQEMLVVINFKEQQKTLVEQIYSSMRTYFVEKEGEVGVEVVNFHEKAQTMMIERVSGFVIKIYEDIFTDEEVDEMIQIFLSPAFKRFQAMTPEITQRITNHVIESMDEIQAELEKMYDEVTEKMLAEKSETEV